MLGIDGQHLPQTVFTLGFVAGDGSQPQPGVFVARLVDQHEVE
jgi:hypothetical protein